jgi:putative transposase
MKWITSTEIMFLTKLSKVAVLKRAKKEGWVRRENKVNKSRGLQFEFDLLPDDIKIMYLDKLSPAVAKKRNISIDQIKDCNKKRGFIRASIIREYKKHNFTYKEFTDLYNAGKFEFSDMVRNEYRSIDASTLYRWVKKSPDCDIVILATRYGIHRKGTGERAMIHEHKQVLMSLYLTTSQYSMMKCYREFKKIFPEVKMSYDTVKRFFHTIPQALVDWLRKGSKTLNDKYMPFITRDYSKMRVMDCWVSDHHQLDVFVKEGNSVYRPWVTVFTDEKSRKILGWYFSRNPSTYTILQSLWSAIRQFGAPKCVKFDNGRDYRSRHLRGYEFVIADDEKIKISGVLESFKIETIYVEPYHGQSKNVERWFGTLAGDFSKTIPSYIGSNTALSLEEHKYRWDEIKDRIKTTLEDVKNQFEKYVNNFNKNWKHSGNGMNLRTPDEVFQEETKDWIRISIPDDYLNFLFAKQFVSTVRRDGVHIEGIPYYSPELVAYKGKGIKVIVKRDINDISRVKVYDKNEVFICDAVNTILTDTGSCEENIRNVKKARKDEKNLLKKVLELSGGRMEGNMAEQVAKDSLTKNKRVKKEASPEKHKKVIGFFG